MNALANKALAAGHSLVIWYRTTPADRAVAEEAAWMQRFGLPPWNRRDERSLKANLQCPDIVPSMWIEEGITTALTDGLDQGRRVSPQGLHLPHGCRRPMGLAQFASSRMMSAQTF